jgi:NADP-dependent 3-hydroxy acid dehydrogenase YdfG
MKRVVFITGATSGIGLACAEKFATAGDDLVITGRRAERLESLEISLKSKYKIECHSACFDVQDKAAVEVAIENLPDHFKNVDVLINNAGLALGRDYFQDADMHDWDTMINTNINGLVYVSRAVIPAMIKCKTGHIINLGSIAGQEVYEKGNMYCATKFAVDALSKSMRIDLLKHHIKVTNISPGAVNTEFSLVRFKGNQQTADRVYDNFTPLTAEDIADSIFYCASLPKHVCINELTITPTAQANTIYFSKDEGSK